MSDIQDGQTATNPKTGQKVVYRGGQWHSAGPVAPASSSPQLTGAGRNQALQKISSLQALRGQAARAASIYNQDFSKRGPVQSISEFMPSLFSDTNAKYDAALSGLLPLARQAFRVPGSGADSDKESAAFMAVAPTRYTNDAGAKQKYDQMFQIIDSAVSDQQKLVGINPQRRGQFKVVR